MAWMKHINLFQLEMMEVRMVNVKLYSIIRLNVVEQTIHRSLNRDALDSCDFYQLSPISNKTHLNSVSESVLVTTFFAFRCLSFPLLIHVFVFYVRDIHQH